jgi:aryl-alcohol dehydrogenase-like predicted oxidoreductase
LTDRAAPARLGLGTAPFIAGYGLGDGARSVERPEALVHACFDAGFGYVDTSADYGEVEAFLGSVAALVDARRVRVCAKVPLREWPDGVDAALRRLRAPRVDTVMLHSASGEHLTRPDVAQQMLRLKVEGRTALTGASTYGIADAQCVLDQPWGDAVQVEHSILNPSVVAALASRKRATQEIVVRSVLCKGLLTARRAHAALDDRRAMAMLDALEARATAWGFASLAELAVRFALDTPAVDVVLVGIATRAELAVATSAAARPPLDARQYAALAEFDRSAEDWTHPERWTVHA